MKGITRLDSLCYGPAQIKGNSENNKANKANFSKFLTDQLSAEKLKMSRHATERLASRNIELSLEEKNAITKAIDALEEKGANNGLIIVNDKAAVVSVKNKTLITVMSTDSSRGNVFTNIDSAVIA